jgi:hypothetical protein
MTVRWIPLRLARQFLRAHHRHRPSLVGGIIALGAWSGETLVGVVVLGRASRMDPAETVTVTRLCTDGTPNVCSKLYAKARRLAQALGFVRVKTFTRLEEAGASLFAAGAEEDGRTTGGAWSREGRPRADEDTDPKRRWSL